MKIITIKVSILSDKQLPEEIDKSVDFFNKEGDHIEYQFKSSDDIPTLYKDVRKDFGITEVMTKEVITDNEYLYQGKQYLISIIRDYIHRDETKLEKAVEYVKSIDFMFLATIAMILVQTPHSFSVIYTLNDSIGVPSWAAIPQALIFALGFDISILIFTLRRKYKLCLGLGVIAGLLNSVHYAAALVESFDWLTFCGAVIITVTVPLVIYFYSEEL